MSLPKKSVLNAVCKMPGDSKAIKKADKFGLEIDTVSWEDNGRSKNSCWGPCISDMTLNVDYHDLPIIRTPNFEDVTWDVQLQNINMAVGNEHGQPLQTVSLKEYMANFPKYLHNAPEGVKSMLVDSDTHAIMSSQACFLPIEDDEVKFTVNLYNYQSIPGDPSVLAIVASANGTSAQVIENRGGSQQLFFNQNGERCPFTGQRLSTHRKKKTSASSQTSTGPMTDDEKSQNMLLIIQIPLKQKNPPSYNYCSSEDNDSDEDDMECDVEDAIIGVGTAEGVFTELNNLSIERNPDFPIRVTLQYYKATSNGKVGTSEMEAIYKQLADARQFGSNVGSLVVEGNTNRPTESKISK